MDDRDIIKLFFSRDEDGISALMRKYGRLCLSISRNILQNENDSEECLNDTLLAVWNSIPPDHPDCLQAYICKISRNLSLKRLEYNTAKKRNPELLVSLDEIKEILYSDSIEHNYDVDNLSRLISMFLRSENQENRIVFIRKYWYFDSISDISTRYSISKSKVKSILYHTRNRLKRYLIQEGYYE